MSKYIICCDFDGVLHSYDSGWKGAAVIPDPPVEGAMSWLADMAHDDRFEVAIYSSRSKDPAGIDAMKLWLSEHLIAFYTQLNTLTAEECIGATRFVLDALTFPTQKPAAAMTIDDRAFHFKGTFPNPDWLLAFKPWNKQPPVTITVNGRPRTLPSSKIFITYEDVVAWAVEGGGRKGLHSVMWSVSRQGAGGLLSPGQRVMAEEGMHFSSMITDNA